MGRSLFRMLHRRFGTRFSGAERVRRAREHHERLRSVMPLGVLEATPSTGPSPGSVAIIGAGFAGCAAAYVLNQLNFDVTTYDAIGTPGGRVTSSQTIIPGRILETGAELIGLNHPVWITLANIAGFALGVVTPEDDYAGVGLNMPLILNKVSYNQDQQAQLYEQMQVVFNDWIEQSAVVVMPWMPWLTPNASYFDNQNLGAQIKKGTPPDVVTAIETEFELNNTVPIPAQSWLANLAQFQAGGGQGFFDDTEVFRSTAGNQRLAYWLVQSLPQIVTKTVTEINTSSTSNNATVATLTFQDNTTAGPFDYVILATSVAIWPLIKLNGVSFPLKGINSGPAIKYLAPVTDRFWITESLSPSGMSDTLGMTWEGTDNQDTTAGFDLAVFSGGSAAKAAINAATDQSATDAYFASLFQDLYPNFSTPGGTFVNAPGNPNIGTGYSCPAPGEVVNNQQSYVAALDGCVFVAGEHTSPAWFGFMEGALESGLVAAARVALSQSVDLKPEWGGTKAL